MSFMNIAHRGFSSHYPENTLLAFQKTLELGITWIEFDLQITQDNHLVVIHDQTVDRTTTGSGSICDLTLDQIKTFDAGIKFGSKFAGEVVPTFEETLDLLSGLAHIEAELKFNEIHPIQSVVKILRNKNMLNQVSLSSFNLNQLPLIKSLCPQISTTALIKPSNRSWHHWIQKAPSLGVDILGPHCSETTQEVVDLIHAAGLTVRCWGLGENQGPEMERLIDLGIDGLTSDFPNILQTILKRRGLI